MVVGTTIGTVIGITVGTTIGTITTMIVIGDTEITKTGTTVQEEKKALDTVQEAEAAMAEEEVEAMEVGMEAMAEVDKISIFNIRRE